MAAGPQLTIVEKYISTATTTELFPAPGNLPGGGEAKNSVWEVDWITANCNTMTGARLKIGDFDCTDNADRIYVNVTGTGTVDKQFAIPGVTPGVRQATTANLAINAITTGTVDIHVVAAAHKAQVIRA